ncbi:hypothetical protein GPECTOR_17g912 [Gonium pectorale]|uniref:LTD domain-containing protein n=1 Tax=Gonium pectorale TaxID=33097 RepID=A0A150GKA5_GONPE|nr:hypothetical protein GPECTOR_17g912 [Gonium pectorale]|eukprot:KXZ50273.1 hypothetical protein GPECTOR_17g912 [Gonium pectorale]
MNCLKQRFQGAAAMRDPHTRMLRTSLSRPARPAGRPAGRWIVSPGSILLVAALFASAALSGLAAYEINGAANGAAAAGYAGRGGDTGGVRINEMMAVNRGAVLDELGDSPDWLELYNGGEQEVSLKGWQLQGQRGDTWEFPGETAIAAGGYLLVYASGRKNALPAPTGNASSPPPLRASFKLSGQGEQLNLLRPDGRIASTTGPFIYNVTRPRPGAPRPPLGEDIVVNISTAPNLGPVGEGKVALLYVVNWGQEQQVAAQRVETGADGVEVFSATIPHAAFSAGDMVRWRAKAADASGLESVFPVAADSIGPASATVGRPLYYGTVIDIPEDQVVTREVPVLEWFSPDPEAATTADGAPGQAVFYNGRLYDGVFARRRGVTALSWPKPKLKFNLDEDFYYSDDMPPVPEFGLQSFWYVVMRDAGVIAPYSFYLHVRLNGKFYGLFSFVEILDSAYLKVGTSMRCSHGWCTGQNQADEDWQLLANLSRGLAGGGPVPRSKFVFDALNLPQIINNLAAQAVVNNMDRCTKNFFMYMHPGSREWYMLPWDMDGSFGQDNGLGGSPGPNYCVLACEQWNSPLYCDSEHPQDLMRMTPWGPTTVKMSYEGPAVRKQGSKRLLMGLTAAPGVAASRLGLQGRALLQSEARARRRAGAASTSAGGGAYAYKAAGPNITQFPTPRGWADPDRSTVSEASVNGPLGTYNHLYDALLDVNVTRSLYLRRLRTLADKYLGGGLIAQYANETHARIKPLADLDAKTWNSGISIDRGYQQITTEFLPIRTEQLLGSLYGPAGRRPLLPERQPQQAPLYVALSVSRYGRGASSPKEDFVEVANANPFAVDMSGWALRGATSFTFPPGAAIPASSSAYVVADVAAFRQRSQAPKGGMGLVVLGPLQPTAAAGDGAAGGALELLDASGASVHRLNISMK